MELLEIVTIVREGVLQIIKTAGPFLISALVVGLIVAILQASTSIQEQTLTFVFKVLTILLILFLLGGFLLSSLGQYTTDLFRKIPEMAGKVVSW